MEIEAKLTIEVDGSETTVSGSGKDLAVRFDSVRLLVRCIRAALAFKRRQALMRWMRVEGICCRLLVGEQVLAELGQRRERKGWYLGGKRWRVWPLRWVVATRAIQRD